MKVSSVCFALLVFVSLWDGSKAAASASPKRQAIKTITPKGKTKQGSATASPLQKMLKPKTALKVVSTVMLAFGVSGLVAPNFHYSELAGVARKDSLTAPVRVYMILFAARETIMATWFILAANYLSDNTCRFLASSIAFALVPIQVVTFLKHKQLFRDDAYLMLMILQFVVFSYLGLSVYTN